MAEHVKNNCRKSDADKKSTIATKPSSGKRFNGEEPNVQNLFLSATSLGTNLVSHRNLLQAKSYLTQGVLCSKHLVQILDIRGSPLLAGGIFSFLNISMSEKSPIPRHSRHPALFHSAQSVHSSNSVPQFSSQATAPQMPQLRIRPMHLSSSIHLSQTRILSTMGGEIEVLS